jgi:glycosyltransferase involved in cell wall biosynthesis
LLKNEVVDTTRWNCQPEVSVILPCHNEADIIDKVVLEFYEELNGKVPFEIVVCEDGSTDGTKDVLRKLSKDIPMKAILGYERKGYAGGLKDGLKLVQAKYVFFVDADGQHTAADFWKLYALRKQYDAVSGWRVKRADNFYRRAMSKTFQFLAKRIFGLPKLNDITAPFKIVRTDVAKQVAEDCRYMKESFWTEFTIRLWLKRCSLAEKPVFHKNRLGYGSTRVYKPWKIPKIVTDQISGLLKLWKESNSK